jgi:hypothetical protein
LILARYVKDAQHSDNAWCILELGLQLVFHLPRIARLIHLVDFNGCIGLVAVVSKIDIAKCAVTQLAKEPVAGNLCRSNVDFGSDLIWNPAATMSAAEGNLPVHGFSLN